ncbi:asparagine--tRNA ligase [Clavulina sp. PMI_390]|nr:asparagine--tRNA ligase [Clavulina sp. PMI_390]
MKSRRALSSLAAAASSRLPPRQLSPTIRHLLDTSDARAGESVNVRGWVRSIRKQKAVTFIAVNDGSSVESLQVVAPRESTQDVTLGSSISCHGTLEQSPGPNQPMELQASRVKILGSSSTTYPIQKKAQSAEFLRRHPHLRTRTPQGAAIMRLRDQAADAFHRAYRREDFILVQPPILTANDCEGAGEAFRVTTDANLLQGRQPTPSGQSPPHPEFFDQPTYLTVSTQLHLEALASSLGRVYTISPVFRAEPSQTHRHVSEFSMLEAELAFCDDLEDILSLTERTFQNALSSLRARASPELNYFREMQEKYGGHPLEAIAQAPAPSPLPLNDDQLVDTIASSWSRMTYHEAVKELVAINTARPGKPFFEHPIEHGLSLQSEHEKWLAGTLVKGPVFVTDYPASLKPFYMRANDDGQTVACFDLLVPRIGELVGGSLREERLEPLVAAMQDKGVGTHNMEWYLDLRRYGSVPHGGFGLGFERFISWITGFENIRDCMPFPRAAGKIQL